MTRIKELGEMARKAIGMEIVKVISEIDPSETVAHGAAVIARKIQEEPHKFVIEQPSGDVRHDEL